MNWVDLTIIGLLIFFVYESLHRSFIGELLDFFSFLLAFFLSLRFYNAVAAFYSSNFDIPKSLATILGFITLWFLVEAVFFGLIHLFIHKIPGIEKAAKFLKPFSPIPAFSRGLIFISILLVLVGTFPIQPKIKIAVHESTIGSYILDKTQRLEGPLKNVFGGLTQDTLSFLTVKPKSDESVDLGFQITEFKANPKREKEMIALVNKERTSLGLKALTYNEALQEIGRKHSTDMFKRGYFAHNSPEGKSVADRAEEAGYFYLVIGENLAYAPDLDLAHTGLMNSPGHKANILSEDFNKVGIGIMDGGAYGLMVTQVFSN